MEWVRILLSRCAALFRRHRLDEDLDDELRSHIELAVEENRARGMNEQEARTAALRAFGGLTQTKEIYRVQRGLPFLEQMGRDLRFGYRQLRRSPGFAITAILTLALGVGANTAVFSLINGLLLRPLPVPHAEELTLLQWSWSRDRGPNYSFSAPMFRALEKRHEVFQSVAGFSSNVFLVRSGSGNVEMPAALVSGQFFQAMETSPLLGRCLTPQDDQPGGGSTGFAVVISEGLWQAWFNRAPDVVGRRLYIANAPFTVVGVIPKHFNGADPTRRPDIYAPLWAEPVVNAPGSNIAEGYHMHWLRVIARRNPDVSLEQANAALRAATNPILDESIPDAKWIRDARSRHFQLAAEPGSNGYSYLRSAFVKPLVAVFSLCAAMLLLACLNLASLLMARSAARERELATRLAMGATRIRLIQQLMVESLLIALLGTAAGLITVPIVSRALAAFVLGNNRSATLDTALDLRAFAFVALTACVVIAAIGLIPALRATSKDLNEQIKSGSHAATARERRRLLPRILMGLEVGLALTLVVGAGLLATSLARLYHTGLGFDPKSVVNLGLNMGKQSLDGQPLVQWYQAYDDSLSRLPAVKSVSFAAFPPMSGSLWSGDLGITSSISVGGVYLNRVAPAYFKSMRIPLLSGRDFEWSDTPAASRKIVLSRTAAGRLFPAQSAIGQHVTMDNVSYEVIAVVGDIVYASIREGAHAEAYLPITQSEDHKPSYMAVVRLEGSPVGFAAAARSLAAKMAPEIPTPEIMTMSSDIDASISSERMMAMLAMFFAVCALLVTAIGLYGTLAYATARRTSEIGIRMAMGARRTEVVGLVFRENAWLVAGGSLAGLVVALLASQTLASFLYGTSVRDPWVMLASVLALGTVAGAASLIPAIRAARIDPMAALREE
jgi:predicted permease